MYVEEISLSAPVDELEINQAPEEQTKVAGLVQANRLRHCRSEFVLLTNHRLLVNTQGFMQQRGNYMLDIGMLDPQPAHSVNIAWRYLLLFAALCMAAWFIDYVGVTREATLGAVVLGVCAVPSLLLAIFRSHDRLVFYSMTGRVPLVVLCRSLPDQLTVEAFSDVLIEYIIDARSRHMGTIEALNAELKAHRHLMEEGVISRKRYDIVKQRILDQHSARV
jgi:hypothetical protein